MSPCFKMSFLSTKLCHCGCVSCWVSSLDWSCCSLAGKLTTLFFAGWGVELLLPIAIDETSFARARAELWLASEGSSLSWRPSNLLNCCPERPGSVLGNSDRSLPSDTESTTSLNLLGRGGVFKYNASKSMDWNNWCFFIEG